VISRFSNMLGESLLFFISISLLSILSLSFFTPFSNILLSDSYETYESAYKYGYRVEFLRRDAVYLYLINVGREIRNITELYLDGIRYSGPIFIFQNGSWQLSRHIDRDMIFRVVHQGYNISKLDLIVDDKYVLHIQIGESS